jgi:hypothetical protein
MGGIAKNPSVPMMTTSFQGVVNGESPTTMSAITH